MTKMGRLAWLTDLHLNFIERREVEDLCKVVLSTNPDALLITGDIATSANLCRYLEFLADSVRLPIYFVLGNHDYYHSSIRAVNSAVSKIVKQSQHLVWLSRSRIIELSPDTCLIGHEGLADGRLGDPQGSQVILNDYFHIAELNQPTKDLRLEVQHKLGDEAAAYLWEQLQVAIDVRQYKKIIVALHAPPFAEACWHLGQNSDDNYLPHFGCKATGEVLKSFAAKNPNISITVYCGHTHSSGYARILPNLQVYTSGAEYRDPRITGIIDVDASPEQQFAKFDPAKHCNNLFELVSRITPENMHATVSTGKPVGKEIL